MKRLATLVGTILIVVTPAYAQQPSARQVAQERAQAEADVPKLVDVLGLKPGMSVGDVGAGFGAVTVVLGKWIGDGHIFATDIGERQLRVIREYAETEGLKNVTVIEGAAAATNLPANCCDAIFMRDVYHHITAVEPFNKSLLASLKPGGRLAIIDFLPDAGSKLPAGVPANRGGHGISPAIVVEEMTTAGFTHIRTIDNWPPGDKPPFFHLSLFTKNVQQPDAAQIAQERAEAEYDAPHLVEVLGLKPGMSVADIGTGGGAMSVVLGKWIGSGRVYATDITESALQTTREYAKKEGLTNVTVIEGGADRTNLPPQCCDALFLRHVYHHITAIDAFNKNLLASLKPGGRLAIIDFVPRKGSPLPEGVPANRGGHGIPPSVVIEEMTAAGFTYVRTVEDWPPGKKGDALFLTLFTKAR